MVDRLTAGQLIVVGDELVAVSAELAAAFRPGDRLIAVAETGDLLHVPAAAVAASDTAVDAAVDAFAALAAVSDEQIDTFFDTFAERLADDAAVEPVLAANAADVAAAEAAGRSTTRLVLDAAMRTAMIDGLRVWRESPLRRSTQIERHHHDGWHVDAVSAPLGVVGFVFEGRPNVFADAAGVVRTGNTVVMRIGRDALGTATAIVEHVVAPALEKSGLPAGTVSLLRSPERSAGWAMFADRRLGLAVARGSGPAVSQLGAVARQAGVPVSLHGTGGAWLVAGESAAPDELAAAVTHSLDRKVCNTLNVCCVPRDRPDLVDTVLSAATAAAQQRSTSVRLHVAEDSVDVVPEEWFDRTVTIRRADGDHDEPQATRLPLDELGTEWEWEGSPELTLVAVDDVDTAIALCNRHSPQFVASLVSSDRAEHDRFYAAIDAPFVGNGFTRWVDGQYALDQPELGLANWQGGRLLGRGPILSGASVHTIRYRATVTDPSVRR